MNPCSGKKLDNSIVTLKAKPGPPPQPQLNKLLKPRHKEAGKEIVKEKEIARDKEIKEIVKEKGAA
jgi:hypothetical protein